MRVATVSYSAVHHWSQGAKDSAQGWWERGRKGAELVCTSFQLSNHLTNTRSSMLLLGISMRMSCMSSLGCIVIGSELHTHIEFAV